MILNNIEFKRVSDSINIYRATIEHSQAKQCYFSLVEASALLIALWGEDNGEVAERFYLNLIFYLKGDLLVVKILLDAENPAYQDISPIFPSASRMQRATYDLFGFTIIHPSDDRAWFNHQAWALNHFPLQQEPYLGLPDNHPSEFIRVQGEGVHDIPVGPVHAGIIESGHFRFQVMGEKILKLEERLGYKHKGIEKKFEGMHFRDAARLAGRISGDSTVAYAWAYAMAIEQMANVQVPERGLWLRALCLERERIINHLGDMGGILNDTGFGFGLAHCSRLKEDLLRTHDRIFKHRYMMDCVIPGGVTVDLSDEDFISVQSECEYLQEEIKFLKKVVDNHGGIQDRLMGTGVLTKHQAQDLEVFGLCARASGLHCDQRVHNPCFPYRDFKVHEVIKRTGDVAARFEVRYAEIIESIRIIKHIISVLKKLNIPDGVSIPVTNIPDHTESYGWVEGFRGAVLMAVKSGTAGHLSRVHPHDPSWANWPALALAVLNNIVPDFPLINKSFNLSYAGHDL